MAMHGDRIPEGSDPSVTALVAGNTAFALSLYRQLASATGNLLFSPFSISAILALTCAGARGRTQTQMADTLCLPTDSDAVHPAFNSLLKRIRTVGAAGRVALNNVSSLWPHADYAFLPDFLSLAQAYYSVSITPVNYQDPDQAQEQINTWVEEETAGKITKLIPSGVLNSLTRLVLANVIYFKGDWVSQFDKAHTRDAPFYPTPRQQVMVPMMHQRARFGFMRLDGLLILELPYQGRALSMFVLLPEERDGLAKLERDLCVENLQKWTERMFEMEVEVTLPQVTLSTQIALKDALMALGMVDAFDGADFSGMDGTTQLFISAVLHQAYMMVNEEGTEAAAASSVVMQARSLPLPPPVFCADHPFLFLIMEKATRSTLFLGKVTNPVA